MSESGDEAPPAGLMGSDRTGFSDVIAPEKPGGRASVLVPADHASDVAGVESSAAAPASSEAPAAEAEAPVVKVRIKSPGGRFERTDEKVGQGSFKVVYVGYDTESGREIAWNEVLSETRDSLFNEGSNGSFQIFEEVETLRRVRHPNIIHFFDEWHDDSEFIFITELMTHGTINDFAKKHSVKTPVLQRWSVQILDAIEYLHTLDPPIVHRDIKGDNIFINGARSEVKIGDLGLCAVKSGEFIEGDEAYVGTPHFMSPDMWGGKYTEKADIWSFGMVLIEVTTRTTPYEECPAIGSVYMKIVKGDMPDAFAAVEDPELASFIASCLKPDAETPSATELLRSGFLAAAVEEIEKDELATPRKTSAEYDGGNSHHNAGSASHDAGSASHDTTTAAGGETSDRAATEGASGVANTGASDGGGPDGGAAAETGKASTWKIFLHLSDGPQVLKLEAENLEALLGPIYEALQVTDGPKLLLYDRDFEAWTAFTSLDQLEGFKGEIKLDPDTTVPLFDPSLLLEPPPSTELSVSDGSILFGSEGGNGPPSGGALDGAGGMFPPSSGDATSILPPVVEVVRETTPIPFVAPTPPAPPSLIGEPSDSVGEPTDSDSALPPMEPGSTLATDLENSPRPVAVNGSDSASPPGGLAAASSVAAAAPVSPSAAVDQSASDGDALAGRSSPLPPATNGVPGSTPDATALPVLSIPPGGPPSALAGGARAAATGGGGGGGAVAAVDASTSGSLTDFGGIMGSRSPTTLRATAVEPAALSDAELSDSDNPSTGEDSDILDALHDSQTALSLGSPEAGSGSGAAPPLQPGAHHDYHHHHHHHAGGHPGSHRRVAPGPARVRAIAGSAATGERIMSGALAGDGVPDHPSDAPETGKASSEAGSGAEAPASHGVSIVPAASPNGADEATVEAHGGDASGGASGGE